MPAAMPRFSRCLRSFGVSAIVPLTDSYESIRKGYIRNAYISVKGIVLDFSELSFGERLRRAREAAGLTQVELAERLGIKQNQISQWEADNTGPKRDRLPTLAAAVGASIEWLLSGTGKAPRHVARLERERLTSPDDEEVTISRKKRG